MKEKDWLSASNPEPLFEYLEERASDRKARLFAVACARRVARFLATARCKKLVRTAERLSSLAFEGAPKLRPTSLRDAIDLGERTADEAVAEEDLRIASEAASAFTCPAGDYAACYDDSQGRFDTKLMAASEAAEAASCTCRHGVGLEAAAVPAARAVAQNNGSRDGREMDAAERAIQCDLLRDIFGKPFRKVKVMRPWLTPNVISVAQAIYSERAFDRMPILADALEDAGCTNADILNHCRQPGEHVRGCWAVDLLLQKK